MSENIFQRRLVMSAIQTLLNFFHPYRKQNIDTSVEKLVQLMDQIDIDDPSLFKLQSNILLVSNQEVGTPVSFANYLVKVELPTYVSKYNQGHKLKVLVDYLVKRHPRSIEDDALRKFAIELRTWEQIYQEHLDTLKHAKKLLYVTSAQKLTDVGFGTKLLQYYYHPKHEQRMKRMYDEMLEDAVDVSDRVIKRPRKYSSKGGRRKFKSKRKRR